MKIERVSWVFISAHGSGSERSEEEIEEFWSFGRNESVVVLGDLNAKVRNEIIEGIDRQHGVAGRNESVERLLEMCTEQELLVGNCWFKKKYVYKYMYVVENGGTKGGRQGIDGLCVATKTNAWKTVRCESVERRRWRNV